MDTDAQIGADTGAGTAVELAVEDPAGQEARALLAASDAFAMALYPAESNHLLDVETLRGAAVTFLVARAGGRAVGCGAIVRSGADWAEIKRMFVADEARGLGVGRRLLLRLEEIAAAEGIAFLRLETGIRQPTAIGLYRGAGFADIPPFGDYAPDPLSLFMEKRITAGRPT
ncbi:GNAT family N-acetyltransferase [Arenibaculum pallidiluteum]|uniref:GNAT family N-acetyltransferase n=1 Tax=Arenibaculum pallidiluteum TaxID=2812559 RepID=UPI001A963D05|nr:GNAT family N-acetyltransferase [Arenibaculum pallidiluteum]